MSEYWHQDVASVGIRVELAGTPGAYTAIMTDTAPGRKSPWFAGYILDINEKWMPVMANPLAKVFKTQAEAVALICKLVGIKPTSR